MNFLHIHQDYPDGRPYPYTKAVSNLIDACQQNEPKDTHTVVSINRTSNPFKVSVRNFSQGISFVYWAIPLPFIYYLSMKLSAYFICSKVKGLNIDIIHGHKLTSEGVLAYFLSKKVNKPYVLSIRGGSDIHNIKRLSVHKNFFAKVFNKAAQVFWVSAWAKEVLQVLLPIKNAEVTSSNLLPNICDINLAYPHKSAEKRKKYITAISYHQYKRKGIPELFQAIAMLDKQGIPVELDIYGSGELQYKNEIEQLIGQFKLQSNIHLKGQVTQNELLMAMSNSKGFLMPAVNETFGMAYIEALSVGCPILYVGSTGIDGYFNTLSVGEKITKVEIEALSQAIKSIETNNISLCQGITKLQLEGHLALYTSSQVANHYLVKIKSAHYV
jgi:glycosyltransferase involved in cell wall biosynthesis